MSRRRRASGRVQFHQRPQFRPEVFHVGRWIDDEGHQRVVPDGVNDQSRPGVELREDAIDVTACGFVV